MSYNVFDIHAWQNTTPRSIERVAKAVADYEARIQQMRANGDLKPEAVSRMNREAAAAAIDTIVSNGKSARRTLTKELEALQKREADAWRRQSDSLDWAAVTARSQEFRAQLGNAGDEVFGGETGPAVAARLRAQMLQSGDATGLRALRLATADHVQDWRRNPTTAAAAIELHKALESDARPAELGSLEVERSQLQEAIDKVDSAVRNAEYKLSPEGVRTAMSAGVESPMVQAVKGYETDIGVLTGIVNESTGVPTGQSSPTAHPDSGAWAAVAAGRRN